MAKTEFTCNVSHGFNFQKDTQEIVGHITSLKIGTTEYGKDLAVQDPTKIGDDKGKVKVVGILSYISWNGGYADPVLFDCRLSIKNKQTAALQQHTTLSNTNVEMSFIVYDYDPLSESFYPAFHTNTQTVKGLLMKDSDGALGFQIEMDQAQEVESPKNFVFSLGVLPQETEQELHLAVSNSDKFVKKWGVTVAADSK
jgi:hypothetical protein